MRFTVRVNDVDREVTCPPEATLLEVLRGLGYVSVKRGCDQDGTCGSCTVLLDGEAVLSCLTPAPRVAGHSVTTVEGLGHPGAPHALQRAFVEAGAVQCGYCTPGMILAAHALLRENLDPSDAEIADGLSGNLCRCTGYVKIVDGVRRAAASLREEAGDVRGR